MLFANLRKVPFDGSNENIFPLPPNYFLVKNEYNPIFAYASTIVIHGFIIISTESISSFSNLFAKYIMQFDLENKLYCLTNK